MRYRVAFYGRIMSDGSDSGMQPSAELDLNIPEGVVLEKELVEKLETEAQHSQEVLDEDDAFLGSAATEVWEYEVVNQRAREFEDALENSDLVLEADVVDTTVTTADEAPEYPPPARPFIPPIPKSRIRTIHDPEFARATTVPLECPPAVRTRAASTHNREARLSLEQIARI